MKKLYLIFLSIVTLSNTSFSQIKVNSLGNLIISSGKGIHFGDAGDWVIEHWEGGFNIAKQWPTLNDGNYKLFINDNDGNVGLGYRPDAQYKLDVNGAARFDVGNYNFIIDNTMGVPTIRSSTTGAGYLGTSSYVWYKTYTNYIYRTAEYTLSDNRVKDNIHDLTNPFELLNKVKGVKFDYTEKAFGKVPDQELKILLNKGKSNFGFIAQDIKEVLPQLVDHDDSTDLYYINYEGMLPLIVEAVKELKLDLSQKEGIILDLSKRISELEKLVLSGKVTENNSDIKSTSSSLSQNPNGSIEQAILEQNMPNPFTEETQINYYLPEQMNSAVLYIYDMQGSQIKSIGIFKKGNGSITINGNELKPGMYLYSLLIDGKEIDTKKMILTD